MKSYISAILFLLLLTACNPEQTETPIDEVEAPPVEETEDEAQMETEENTDEISESSGFDGVLSQYAVLESFDTDSPGTGLGEGLEVIHRTGHQILAHGHQGHAVAFYQLMIVDEENQEIIITHRYREGEEYDELDALALLEDYELAFNWMNEKEPNENRLFFKWDSEQDPSTTELPNGTTVSAIEVDVNDTIYVFSEDIGLTYIHYQSPDTVELFGSEVTATNQKLMD
ncbi:hypothetical protein [Bacillus alkalicellulosilyticus]|uniref:hypothetical protein n=1 Tax=Alkalihalobacterium alkalicellulosilyticum TaxID=1912214 RepID=UPI0009968465|nr:hypothetical protein [Bacillus alkalicellulosilyticus]